MLTCVLKKYWLDLTYFCGVVLFAIAVIGFGGLNLISTTMVILLMFAICVCNSISRHEDGV